ncbi:MAG: DinB family protein [Acidobacteria bacterium]|nr:DinB family protein [Acidobacteriota bacterium]
MESKATLLIHLDYSLWATSKLLDAASRLSSAELTRDLQVSHSSVLITLQHIYYADRTWLARLEGRQIDFADPAPGPTLEQLKEHWPPVLAGLKAYVEAEADLDRQLTSRRLNGDTFTIARWKILLHVVNHATLHRGQVMAMLRQLGHVPPATDLFYFYLQQTV